jgi:hypothetical protein
MIGSRRGLLVLCRLGWRSEPIFILAFVREIVSLPAPREFLAAAGADGVPGYSRSRVPDACRLCSKNRQLMQQQGGR